MIEGIVFLVVALVALTVAGLAVLAPLRPLRRAPLVPAAPLLGAALLAVVLSTTTWVMPVRWSWVVVVAVLGVLVAVAVRRGTLRPPTRRTVVLASGVLLLGAPGMLMALRPSVAVGDMAAVSPTQSHDAFYYVAEAAWLLDGTVSPGPVIGDAPGPGSSSPAFFPMASSLTLSLRIGQPMVHAALSALVGQDPVRNVAAVTALWVLLVAPAAFVAARLVRVPPAGAAAGALVVSSAALVVQQAYQQNVDALLGASLALLALAGVVAAAQGRTARWPAALLLAALVAVYTEYGLYVGPAVLAVLVTRRSRLRRRAVRLGTALALALALAPAAWARGLGTLLIRRDGDLGASPLFSDGWFAAVSRAVGTSPLGGPAVGGLLTVVLAAALLVGVVAAVALHPSRATWLALLAVGGVHLAALTAGHHGYTQLRAATLLLPLVLLATVAGWSALVRAVRGLGAPVRLVAVAAVVALTGAWTVLNLQAVRGSLDVALVADRHVDDDFAELAGWLAGRGGPDGQDVAVAVPDMFDQMWAAYSLRELPEVSYLTARPDYLGRESYWAGAPDRYVVVGVGTAISPSARVVASNDRFALVDTAATPAVVAVPADATRWYPFAGVDGVHGPDDGVVRVVASRDEETAVLQLRPDPPATTVGVLDRRSGERWSVPARDGVATVVLEDLAPGETLLEIDVGDDREKGAQGFLMTGVDDAG